VKKAERDCCENIICGHLTEICPVITHAGKVGGSVVVVGMVVEFDVVLDDVVDDEDVVLVIGMEVVVVEEEFVVVVGGATVVEGLGAKVTLNSKSKPVKPGPTSWHHHQILHMLRSTSRSTYCQ